MEWVSEWVCKYYYYRKKWPDLASRTVEDQSETVQSPLSRVWESGAGVHIERCATAPCWWPQAASLASLRPKQHPFVVFTQRPARSVGLSDSTTCAESRQPQPKRTLHDVLKWWRSPFWEPNSRLARHGSPCYGTWRNFLLGYEPATLHIRLPSLRRIIVPYWTSGTTGVLISP